MAGGSYKGGGTLVATAVKTEEFFGEGSAGPLRGAGTEHWNYRARMPGVKQQGEYPCAERFWLSRRCCSWPRDPPSRAARRGSWSSAGSSGTGGWTTIKGCTPR